MAPRLAFSLTFLSAMKTVSVCPPLHSPLSLPIFTSGINYDARPGLAATVIARLKPE